MIDDEQLSFLFLESKTNDLRFRSQEPQFEISRERLKKWKRAIAQYQYQIRIAPTTQGNLFELTGSHADPETIDPLSLQRHNLRFFESPQSRQLDHPVIYFVFDDAAGLLLYIGQAVNAHQRWSGEHDCRTYLDHYFSANYRHKIKTAICFSFWWDTPAQFKPRLQLEAKLIQKWRSPFNKENRKYWATPFTSLI